MTRLKRHVESDLYAQHEALPIYISSLLDNSTEKVETTSENEHDQKNKPYPDWAQNNIKYLTITIANIAVLIPTTMIKTIKNVTSQLHPSSHMPSWVYNYTLDNDENKQIINTQKLLFDGLRSKRLDLRAQNYAVFIGGGSWGIACDAIGEIVQIDKKNIVWSGKNVKRRWLAGTSNKFNAIIFDISHIEKVLIKLTKN